MLTVILPCAGKGSRLSLPYPKELLSIEQNKVLIDYSFELFSENSKEDINFVITLTEEKLELINYLSKYKSKFNISFTFFNPAEKEFTGSLKSAKHLFSQNNLVLLPDTFLKFKTSDKITEIVKNGLRNNPFIFFFKREKSHKMLSTKGALFVREDFTIGDYEDKPINNLARFNSFWTSFAFNREIFDSFISFMEETTLTSSPIKTDFKNTPLYNSKGIEVEDFIDLGTWPEVFKFMGNKY